MTFIKKTVSILICVLMLFTITSCTNKIDTYSYKKNEIKTVNSKNVKNNFHITNSANLELICSSGLIELYFDKTNYSIAIRETSQNKFWYALPAENNNSANILNLKVTDGAATYNLNSQDNSVAYKKAEYKKIKNGISVSYVISDSNKYAKISIPITVTYKLVNGSFNVKINCKNLKDNKSSMIIESLELLEYFGSASTAGDGDFMLIPDGSGALIKTCVTTAKAKDYNLSVYGSDSATENDTAKSSVVPVYGVKSGTSAFGTIIQCGDAIAEINAKKAASGDLNYVGSKYNITPVKTDVKGNKYKKYVSGNSYTGNISLCYRFVSGSNATYAGIASVCREQLIRDGVLSTKTIDNAQVYPMNLTLVGLYKGNNFSVSKKLTTFEQAQNIAEFMKAKGINNVNLCYKGIFNGGTNQENIKNAEITGKLGNDDDFSSLNDYMTTQGFSLFLDVDLLTSSNGGEKAKNIDNDSIKILKDNELNGYLGPQNLKSTAIRPSNLEDNTVKLLNNMKNKEFTGYCIDDAGYLLYSDYSGKYTNREDASKLISNQIISLSNNKETMAVKGNFYMLKTVDVIKDIPMSTAYGESESYEGIPFVQAILHGTIEYSASALNLNKDYKTLMLKSIEYGAVPNFEWTFSEPSDSSKKKVSTYYDDWLGTALKYYNNANSLFSDIQNARITNHYKVQDNLYCTVYNDTTLIYVNYGNADITYNNLVIKAGGYLRVN